MSKRSLLVGLIVSLLLTGCANSRHSTTSNTEMEELERKTGVKIVSLNKKAIESDGGYTYELVKITDKQGHVSYQLLR